MTASALAEERNLHFFFHLMTSFTPKGEMGYLVQFVSLCFLILSSLYPNSFISILLAFCPVFGDQLLHSVLFF